MAKLIKCAICGTEFMTARPNKKYCSVTCREAGARYTRMKWEDDNQGYNAAYMRKYRKDRKDNGKS